MLKRIINAVRRRCIIHVKDVTRPYEILLKENGRFYSQIVFVTGGSGAIGRAICFRLAAEGAKVYVGGTRMEKIMPVVEEIRSKGFAAEPLPIDLTSEESIVGAFAQIHTIDGKLDLFVDCAGGGARDEMKPLTEQSKEVIGRIINLNLTGAILTAREAARIMKPRQSGKILFISSTVGVRGLQNYSEYAAAKGGIIAFSTSIAMELGKYQIKVNCVTPGIVQRGTIDDVEMQRIRQTNWLHDYGKPEDIAAMVAYLNSDEANFITGQNFIVDGGRSLGLKNS